MRWVQQATLRPHHCAAIPFVGNSNAKKGFFDTGQDLPGWDPHVYVSVEAVEEMARLIGWQPAHVGQQNTAVLEEKDREIALLREQLEEADRFAEAAEYTLGRFGEKVRNKPGRKPRREEEVTA